MEKEGLHALYSYINSFHGYNNDKYVIADISVLTAFHVLMCLKVYDVAYGCCSFFAVYVPLAIKRT